MKPTTAGLVPALLLAACAGVPRVEVQQYGTMQAVMRDAATGPRVALAGMQAPGWHAIGALAGLEGEVTVLDGVLLVERCATVTPRLTAPPVHGRAFPPFDFQATLLTAARVPAWRQVPLATAVDDAGLAAAVAAAVATRAAEPVAFRVRGTAAKLHVHCVRGDSAMAPRDPAKAAFRHEFAAPVPVTLVGFHAPGREGEMTHHGTALHLHVVCEYEGGLATFHVDDLALQAGAVLELPADR